MSGHVPRLVASSALVGRVDPREPIYLALTLPLRNQQELQSLLSGIYNPFDPLYGAYLTPEEFTARFGPTEADYNAVVSFARSQGLQIVNTSPNRAVLDVAGDAATVETAFRVVLNRYRAPDSRLYRAPDREPSLPTEIAAKLGGIAGMDTAAVRHHHAVRRPETARPRTIGGSGPLQGLSPSDFKTAYNLTGAGLTGAGQTLAVFELDGFVTTDITTYERYFGLGSPTLQTVAVDGGIPVGTTSQSGRDEVTLDIELQLAVASGASKIMVYEGPNTDTGVIDMYTRIATDNLAMQAVATWGLNEADTGAAAQSGENTAFVQMAAQGQSMFAAGGDEGAYDNYGVTLATGVQETPVICVDDPASQPYVTAVGGTTASTNGAGGAWLSETTWNGGLTGGAGGGGISQYWSIPSYQVGVGSTVSGRSTTMRNVPDVSLNADPNNGYSIYSGGTWVVYGGTSCAAPLYSGIAAVINQQRAANGDGLLGFANPPLYTLGQSSQYSSTFHDIADNSTNLYYHAVTGYDLATGWGSPKGASLIAALAPAAAAPTLTAITPASVNAGSAATTIAVTGNGFLSASHVQWRGANLATTYVSATQLTAVIPTTDLTTAGAFSITVTNSTNSSSTSGAITFAVNNPTPVLGSVSPASTTAGSAATTITLSGTSFVSGTQVLWNGNALKATYVSASKLTAVVPASNLSATGTFTITVANPTPGGGTSGSTTFAVVAPTPVLTSLSPTSALTDSATTTVTLTGSKFLSGAQVLWNRASLSTTYVSATKLTAVVPASDLTTAGTFSIAVSNPGTGGPTSAAVAFTVKNPTPALHAVSPALATVGSSSTTVTLTGTGFVSGSQAVWDSTVLTTTYGSATTLTAVVPASDFLTTGTHKITVNSATPGGGTSGAVTFSVNNSAPALSGISPGSAMAGSANLTVTATGTGFVKTSQALWDGVGLATTYDSATTVTFVIPKNDLVTAGTHKITIKSPTPGGGTSASVTFSITNPTPAVTGISPNVAITGSANLTVTATGTGFVAASKAQWDGATLATTYKSATTVTFVLPKSDLTSIGAHSITVINATPGGGRSGAVTFAINNPTPVLTAISPASATAGSAATKITLTGSLFVSGAQVMWNGTALTTTYVSATKLTATVPAANLTTAGAFRVTVVNPGSSSPTSHSVNFTVK